MKKVILSFAITLLAISVNAQPPAGNANPGDTYGEKITPDGAINIFFSFPDFAKSKPCLSEVVEER